MKKKGFTLIELLAVIVIIALIALITIPVVGNIIENSRKEAFKRSVEGLSREYEYREVQSDTKLGEVDACTLQNPCKIEGTIKRDTNGEVVLYVTDGRYCTNGKVGSFTVINGTCGIGSGIEEITFNNPNYEVSYSKNNQVIDITPNGGSGDFTYTKLSEKNSLNEDTNYVEVNGSTLIVKPSISVGTYIVSVRIKDNETQLEKEVNIVIEIESVNISNIEIDDIESVDYDGTEQTPEVVVISNGSVLEKDVDYEVEYINSINAGTATIKITGKGNYVGEITKTFTINKVNAPNTSVVGASLDYNGLNQSLITSVNVSNSHIYYSVDTVINSSNYLSIGSETKPTRSEAGTYTVYYYAPADNYNEVIGSVTVTINPITLNIPPQPSDKNYTGGSQASGITCPTGSTVSGSTSATYPGTYTQTCTLNNSNYKWNDNTTTPKDISWVIKGVAEEGTCNTLTYNGNSQTLAQGGEHVTYVNNSGVNAGSYTVTVNAEEGFKFIDGTTSKTLSCKINRLNTATPGSCNTLTYYGSSQTLASGGSYVSYSNNSGVNAGDYTVIVNADNNHTFSDGSISKELPCSINKSNSTMNLSANSGVHRIGINGSIEVTGTGIGEILCSSSDTSVVTCSTSNSIVTIMPNTIGTATLTITNNGDSNYNSSNKTYSATIKAALPATISTCPGCVYSAPNGNEVCNSLRSSCYYPTTLNDYVNDYRTLNKNYFLGFKLNNNNEILKAYACGINGDTPFCIEGALSPDYGGDEAYYNSTKETNKQILMNIYGNCKDVHESSYVTNYICSSGTYGQEDYSQAKIEQGTNNAWAVYTSGKGSSRCYATYAGLANCYYNNY